MDGLPQIQGLVMPGCEQRGVDGQKLLRCAVANHHAGQVGHQAGVTVRLFPDRRPSLFNVRLLEREDQESHVPLGAVLQAGHQMFVGVASERATVVPRDAE